MEKHDSGCRRKGDYRSPYDGHMRLVRESLWDPNKTSSKQLVDASATSGLLPNPILESVQPTSKDLLPSR